MSYDENKNKQLQLIVYLKTISDSLRPQPRQMLTLRGPSLSFQRTSWKRLLDFKNLDLPYHQLSTKQIIVAAVQVKHAQSVH